MAKRHVMTARRKVALRKAQLASARKRGKGKSHSKARKYAKRAAVGVAVGYVAYNAASLGSPMARGGFKQAHKVSKRRGTKLGAEMQRSGARMVSYGNRGPGFDKKYKAYRKGKKNLGR
jgi:hypothetical protein